MYEVRIIPQKFTSWGKNEEEAIKNVLKLLENYKEMFVVEKVKEKNNIQRTGEVVSLDELESYEPKNSIEEEYYDEMWS